MHRVLVTGGLGFIGSNLIKLLIKQKYNVINIDKISYSSNFYNTKEFKKNKKYKFIKCDIQNKKKILPNQSLKNLLGVDENDEVTYFSLQKLMNRHFVS